MAGTPFHRRLKSAREKRGLNLMQAAAELGIYRTSYTRLEEGMTNPQRLHAALALRLLDRYPEALKLEDFAGPIALDNIRLEVLQP